MYLFKIKKLEPSDSIDFSIKGLLVCQRLDGGNGIGLIVGCTGDVKGDSFVGIVLSSELSPNSLLKPVTFKKEGFIFFEDVLELKNNPRKF